MEKRNSIVHSYLVCAIVITVAILLSAETAFGQLIVQPMRIDLTPDPGRVVKTSFEIQNYDPSDIHLVDLAVVDISQWEDGTWRIIEPESLKDPNSPNFGFDVSKLSSCRDWIKLARDRVEVRALRIVPVNMTLRVPPGTRGFYGAGIIATLEGPASVEGTGISVFVRYLVPILLNVQQGRAMQHKVELQGVGLRFSEPNGLDPATTLISANIENNGETFSGLNVVGRVRAFSRGHWREVTMTEFRTAGIIPGVKLRLESDVGRSLPSGKYKVAAGLYVDGRRVKVIEEEIDFVGDPTIAKVASDVALYVEPSEVIIESPPGATRTSLIRVRNESDDTINVRTSLTIPPGLYGVTWGDLLGDELDCSGWVKLMPEKFTLRRGGRMGIRITTNMPNTSNMHACYYGLLSLHATYSDGQNAGVKTAYICAANSQIEAIPVAQPVRLNFAHMEGSRYLVIASFGNFGNTHFTPRCTAAITNLMGVPMDRGQMLLTSSKTGLMLPIEFRNFSGAFDLSDYLADTYFVTATLEYAPGQVVTNQIPIRVSIEGDQRVVELIQPERPGEKIGIELNR
jgi:hypothetical protein